MPRLPLRDLLPSIITTSNLFEFPKEVGRSGNPDYAYPEASDKQQGDFTYSLVQCPICTIAFWIACSRQVITDSVAWTRYIDQRLVYLLQNRIEHELLYGDGGSGHINGLAVQATPATGTPTNLIDATAEAIAQLAADGWIADFIVCDPSSWWASRALKTTIGSYIVGDPLSPLRPQLWGLDISLSPVISPGHFLVGVRNECLIVDRQAATLEISREHASFFTQNLVAILIEERLTLGVLRPEAYVYGAIAGATGS